MSEIRTGLSALGKRPDMGLREKCTHGAKVRGTDKILIEGSPHGGLDLITFFPSPGRSPSPAEKVTPAIDY